MNQWAKIIPGLYCLPFFTTKLVKSIVKKAPHDVTKHMANESKYAVPAWFMEGMDAVMKAPSAINKLPVFFTYNNGIVTAETTTKTGYEYVDLGIAKLHFEIGADYIFYDLRSKH